MAARADTTTPTPHRARLHPSERRKLALVLSGATAALAALIVLGVMVERQARTPLIQVGQVAPTWTLPAASGGSVALSEQRGHVVVLAFVPSVHCAVCLDQLRALQAALPKLRQLGGAAFAISTDLPAVQRTVAGRLGLDYPLLSEAPAVGLHPVGSAYGVYHRAADSLAGPVDVNALVVVDGAGVVRAVQVQPYQAVSAQQILALVQAAA